MAEIDITLSTIESALDLPLRGSVGSFKVASGEEYQSLEVKYFLTHVGLNFGSGSDEKLLKELAPVREIFDPQQLDFDEIMQRDIDDARVSNELIPYILDDKTKDLVKFFPPIVVILLPVNEDRNKPEKYYPKVSCESVVKNKSGVENWLITRAGDIGSEVFEFEQPMQAGKVSQHDLVTLRLNTSKCRLVIVDGQHRAMSMLALYRNLKDQWSDAKRQPFKKYYEEWTPSYIEKFNLSEINLPLIICTIPTLDDGYNGDYNLKKAARSIFLTLNKTARKVSRTRNILLNDNDLISSFLRKTLGDIKDADKLSQNSLSIQNIELDQDKQKLQSPIAISGVSHIYYIIEHILLDSGDINGVSARSGRFSSRLSFSDALDRLNCEDLLGSDVCNSTKRDSFTDAVENTLKHKYQNLYGNLIVKSLNGLAPFEIHNKATLDLRQTLQTLDIDLESMLYEGSGAVNVFEEHRSNLKKKLQENYFGTNVPKIESIVSGLDNTEARLKNRIKELFIIRSEKFIQDCSDKNKFKNSEGKVNEHIVSLINQLYSDVFTTVAFQCAVICGFFNEYEKVSSEFLGEDDVDLNLAFEEYLDQLNNFFRPASFASFKKIVSVLIGHAKDDEINVLKVTSRSNDSFRGVVFDGEMNPDQWPKYRYLLMEIWNPTDNGLGDRLKSERVYCRNRVFKSLYDRKKKYLSQQNNVIVDDLKIDELETAFDQAYGDYSNYLKYFGRASELSKATFKSFIGEPEDGGEEM